jgi:hypothetical protein
MASSQWKIFILFLKLKPLIKKKRSNGYRQIVNGLVYHLEPEDYDARSPNSASNRPIVRANEIRELRSHMARALVVFETN